MDLTKVIHNNVASYMVWKNGTPCRSQKYIDLGEYYILSPGTNVRSYLNSTYFAGINTRLTYTLVPGSLTGDFWIGNMGVNSPEGDDDSRDFRVGHPEDWSYSFVDIGGYRGEMSYIIDENTPKITIEQFNWGCTIYDANGDVIHSQTFGERVSDVESVPIFVQAVPNFKLYSVKIEDDVQGLILDAHCTSAGLIDSVSGNNITPSGWTVGVDV